MKKLSAKIKNNPRLKQFVLWALKPTEDHRPRFWIRWFVNPFFHKRKRGAIVRRSVRLDVFPFNRFDLGERAIVEDFSVINNGVGDVVIGNRSIAGLSSVIIGPVNVGNDVMLAQHVVISGLNHGYKDVSIPPNRQPVITAQTVVGDGVWIGANSVITAGVNIGDHCVIGAGSVVTKDIPAYSVALGNPARIVKQFNSGTHIWEKVI